MSNFPLSYGLSWLPLFLRPSVRMPEPMAPGALQAELFDADDVLTLVLFGDLASVTGRPIPQPTQAMLDVLRRADLVVGNCETPLVDDFSPGISQRLGIVHGVGPQFLDTFLDTFQLAPDKLYLSLANNHALDCGQAGFVATTANLQARRIRAIGCRDPHGLPLTIAERGGLRIGLAAWTRWINRSVDIARNSIWFEPDLEGTDWLGLKRTHALDTLCVLPHWDFEFRHFPQPATRARAAQLARCGVDLVVGQHPHVIQPVERHGRMLCAYSLGDLVTATLRWRTWPTGLFGLLEVGIAASGPRRGSVCRYTFHPFVRVQRGGREEYRGVAELDGILPSKVEDRLRVVFPPD